MFKSLKDFHVGEWHRQTDVDVSHNDKKKPMNLFDAISGYKGLDQEQQRAARDAFGQWVMEIYNPQAEFLDVVPAPQAEMPNLRNLTQERNMGLYSLLGGLSHGLQPMINPSVFGQYPPNANPSAFGQFVGR